MCLLTGLAEGFFLRDFILPVQPFVRFPLRDHVLLWPPLAPQLFLLHTRDARLTLLPLPWNRPSASICSNVQRSLIGKPRRVRMREMSLPQLDSFCKPLIVSEGLVVWVLRSCN